MPQATDIDELNPKNADFQTVEYWDKRYASEAPDAEFDWFRKVCPRRFVAS